MSYNKFRSTCIYGNLLNVDSTDGSIQAGGIFSRDLTIKNNLYIGNETEHDELRNDTAHFQSDWRERDSPVCALSAEQPEVWRVQLRCFGGSGVAGVAIDAL